MSSVHDGTVLAATRKLAATACPASQTGNTGLRVAIVLGYKFIIRTGWTYRAHAMIAAR